MLEQRGPRCSTAVLKKRPDARFRRRAGATFDRGWNRTQSEGERDYDNKQKGRQLGGLGSCHEEPLVLSLRLRDGWNGVSAQATESLLAGQLPTRQTFRCWKPPRRATLPSKEPQEHVAQPVGETAPDQRSGDDDDGHGAALGKLGELHHGLVNRGGRLDARRLHDGAPTLNQAAAVLNGIS